MAQSQAHSASSDEEECYEDASETVQLASTMDLHSAISESIVALNLFLNNHFNEAKQRVEIWSDRSVYHALCYSTILYLQATMTFEAADIEKAVAVVKRSLHLCNQYRKKFSVIHSLRYRVNYNEFTEDELHAELCYAECLIQRAILTFIQDENLINFVKGSLKIRSCHQSYKECVRLFEKRDWKSTDEKLHFESGVRMGQGMFNLMISLLPSKILKLLEFVGFSGNKEKGLSELQLGSNLDKSLRGPLCSMALLGYHTVVSHILGTAEGDIVFAEKLLASCLVKFPNGALFLFFAGRIEEVKGNISQAIVKFEESIDSQAEWRQFHHICFWELMWCHSLRGDWLLAMKYAEKLCRESQWSRATYTYLKAAFLLMCDERTPDADTHVEFLFCEVPRLKQRIAGKSIPVEKFAVKKAKRYSEQNKRLTLPAFEMIYVWNGFNILGRQKSLLEPVLAIIESSINELLLHCDEYIHYTDDYCLALLLKGVCLRHLQRMFQAQQCFTEICSLEKRLTEDTYLVPYTCLELAMLHLQCGDLMDARRSLNKARYDYKGYSLESRLHFRMHSAHLQLESAMATANKAC